MQIMFRVFEFVKTLLVFEGQFFYFFVFLFRGLKFYFFVFSEFSKSNFRDIFLKKKRQDTNLLFLNFNLYLYLL